MTVSTKSRTAVGAAVVGNILEWYDFSIYAYLAAILGKTFFPSDDPTNSLLLSFATFGVGFLVRPLGALVIGRVGDTRGRKVALLITVFMMAIGTTMVGLVPSYASIGITAPLLIVLARLLQGFSAGGEWGGATTFIVEWAPGGGRGFFGSFQQASVVSGMLLGTAVAAMFSTVFSVEDLEGWAWRLPFLFGAILGPIGLYMRKNIEETPAYMERKKQEEEGVPKVVKTSSNIPVDSPLMACARSFGFTVVWTSSFFIFLYYLPTYTQNHAGLSRSSSLWASTICLIALVVLIPLCGHLSDKYGRKPLLLTCCVSMLVLPYPFMTYMVSGASYVMIILMEVVLAFFISMFSGAGPAALSEIFQTRSRSFLLSTSYALATTIFGGFAPFIATWLIKVTGNPISPVYYMFGCALVSAFTIWHMRETAFEELQ
jgi:MHS family proline/betaine transporter-like MFS transporter